MPDFIKRVYVEKKAGFNVEAEEVLNDLKNSMNVKELDQVLVLNRYDILGLSDEIYENVRNCIFVESAVDNYYDKNFPYGNEKWVFAVEYLPGQYDQRASWAEQCIRIISPSENVQVYYAKVYVLVGNITASQFSKIKDYIINSVDSREASLNEFDANARKQDIPKDIPVIGGFINFDDEELIRFREIRNINMEFEDLKFCQEYFRNTEKRDPYLTELKVIDTYWSDHCRHTTFTTEIENISIPGGKYSEILENTVKDYKKSRDALYVNRHKPVTLMDLATIAMKELRKNGKLDDLEESEEINACSIEIDVDVNGNTEKWLLMFKNETHNHPTEIEPFGGAATCLGGAIRDPLSGRAFVYGAMRITGSGDPRAKIEDTIKGKLPQRKITTKAAKGYSSYGNQIGLATGYVKEVYHPGFVAKRMEVGAVIAAVPKADVLRGTPEAGDVIILVGGRTGRDGCGGATGSSKIHNEKSIEECGAEVQKGNAPEERKLQRLFRNKSALKLIKRCNDFGAGGVAVAVGELADGLIIDLDKVPKKYMGLNGTELAISESQERMAVVVERKYAEKFIGLANEENLEATKIADVTDDNRLKMLWRDNFIVDISRDFLNTNGVSRKIDVTVECPDDEQSCFNKNIEIDDLNSKWIEHLGKLNLCSQKGLTEMFDSSIGGCSVMMPYGGKYQGTPSEAMVSKIPVLNGETATGSIMSYGYDPYLSDWSPFHGGVFAIVEAVSKVVAVGGDFERIRLTLQEYFPRLGKDKTKWGRPFSALLGAYYAQKQLEIAAIGGKDSMSGTFEDIEVPSTLIAFAVCATDINNVITPELKKTDSLLLMTSIGLTENNIPDFDQLKKCYKNIQKLIKEGVVLSSHSVTSGGIAEAVSLMSFGNKIGVTFEDYINEKEFFKANIGQIILEVDKEFMDNNNPDELNLKLIGKTSPEYEIKFKGKIINIQQIYDKYTGTLEEVFSSKSHGEKSSCENLPLYIAEKAQYQISIPKPKVFIPVFPGTNCEYDCMRAFEKVGAVTEIKVFRNLNDYEIEESAKAFAKEINNSQIIMLSGGFSASDEPDGSGKFIANVFRNPRIMEAVDELLNTRKGLILGICNGFQALIKLGLVPYGEIREMTEDSPTLSVNEIGHHVSTFVRTRLVSNLSPWFNLAEVGEVYAVPTSHGEGRFIAKSDIIKDLAAKGQIATQYVDLSDNASMEMPYNPNGSYCAVEAITSPDGRVLGKMAHNERITNNTFLNIPDIKDMKIFQSGVNYFK